LNPTVDRNGSDVCSVAAQSAWMVAGTLAAAAAFAILLDLVKVPIFQRLKIT
jgi:hypothetical protein